MYYCFLPGTYIFRLFMVELNINEDSNPSNSYIDNFAHVYSIKMPVAHLK